jgi:amino acid adenylation domain-containing protein
MAKIDDNLAILSSASSPHPEDCPGSNGDSHDHRLAALSPEKRALLQRKLVEKRLAAGNRAIQPRAVTGPCPLSFAQELMWLLDQLTPGVSSYNVPRVFRIRGALNIPALHRALNEIVSRHEILRTKYAIVEGKPIQVINETSSIDLEVIDLRAFPDDQREAEAQRMATELSDRGFDLSQDLLLRTSLLRLGEQEHILIMVSHHVASDGWSKGLIFRELESLYEAFRAGKPSPLPKVALQYGDFAVWQRSYLQGEVLDKLLGYWKRQLDGAPALLELPTDHPRPSIQSGRGKRLPAKFPKALANALKELGRKEGATLFMVGLAAFKVLLHRYTGQKDIVVGTPISGRTRTEVEGIVGYFSNSLALRSNLAGDPTFRELLQRVRKTTLDAYSHQDMPFEKLVVELKPERTLSYSPIYQTMFSVVTAQMEELKLPGLDVSTLFIDRGTAKFDLTLGMRETPDELLAGIEYSSDLFEPATMTRMLGHWRTLLEGIAANPDRRLSQLPILTDAERHQLLVEWSGPRVDYPDQACLEHFFEAQVERTPEAVAVVFGEERLTYRVLNERANQAAHLLRKTGVGKGDFVAILAERRPEFLIAMLAIFKAGAAYVPIDPNYPKDRVQYFLTKSQTPTVFSRAGLIDYYAEVLLACPHLKTIICFDSKPQSASFQKNPEAPAVYDCVDLDAQPRHNPDPLNQPDDPLYMIFTSGSTGLPKGAIIRHNGAVNHIYAQYHALGLNQELAFLQSAPSSSDISVWQFLAPVLIGGKTVIIDEADLLLPEKMFAIIKENRITIVEIVPALLKVFLEYVASLPEEQRKLPDLKWLMVTGESAPVELVNTWFQLYASIKVVNAYGPTEASDDIAQLILEGPLPANKKTVPIGRPLGNLNLYVLDNHLQLVPIGVPGEICVSGVGVGVGYWKDEEKTRSSFVPNPFPGTSGEVIYRTGDLGKWLPDGNLEFLGRIDHQVKIRGYRIELGEIEAALGQHAAVREAVVVAREDTPDNKALAAYVVPGQEPRVSAGNLADFLKQKLPSYMVPASFVFLEKLPLTPNGKVDRKALPVPGRDSACKKSFVPPRTPVEELLAGIWAEVLKIDRVSIDDDFFELGGHSLLATQVISRVRRALQVELALRNIFETPTVAGLALTVFQNLAEAEINSQNQGSETTSLESEERLFVDNSLLIPEY